MSSISNKNVFQIPVKMGSNKISMDFTIEELKSMTNLKFIKLVLRKLGINDKLAKTYVIFESVHGVERLLGDNENFHQICIQIADKFQIHNLKDPKCDVQFVIRKYYRMEKKLMKQNELKLKSMSKKCFKKLKINQKLENQNHQTQNQLPSFVPTSIEREFAKQTLSNEPKSSHIITKCIELDVKATQTIADTIDDSKADKSSIKLCNLHENQLTNNLNEKFSHNIKFLQSLYLKLKKQSETKSGKGYLKSKSAYKKLNETNSCGSSEESDDFDGQSSKTITSTSTLESLI